MNAFIGRFTWLTAFLHVVASLYGVAEEELIVKLLKYGTLVLRFDLDMMKVPTDSKRNQPSRVAGINTTHVYRLAIYSATTCVLTN